MSRLTANVTANFFSKASTALFTLIFVPAYLRLLGSEAYGVVTVFMTAQVVFALSDLGLGSAYSREVAVKSASGLQHSIRPLSNSVELFFFSVAVLGAVAVCFFAAPIANGWFATTTVASSSLTGVIELMGIALGLQLMFLFYQSGLTGLQLHVRLSGLTVGFGLIRGLATVAVLSALSATLEAFFWTQIAISATQLLAGRTVLYAALPRSTSKFQFRFDTIRPLLRFSFFMFGTAITSVLLMQTDKIVVSKYFDLASVAAYGIASVAASVPYFVASPVSSAFYPHFVSLRTMNQEAQLRYTYEIANQLTAFLVVPAGLFLAFFPQEFLLLWLGKNEIVATAVPLVRLLSVGSVLLGLMYTPYALQLASDWPSLAFRFNVVACILLVPCSVLAISHYGLRGPALTWFVLNVAYVIGAIGIMHKRILIGQSWRWYAYTLVGPTIACSMWMALVKAWHFPVTDRLPILLLALLAISGGMASVLVSTPTLRSAIVSRLAKGHA
jgi:O-antigen/teichoic acid export membrane protein